MSSERRARTPPAGSPRVPAQGRSAQGEPAPKARAKAVADGKEANIPPPAGGDGREAVSGLTGLARLGERPGKQPQQMDRTRNRHRWTGRACRGDWGTHAVQVLGKL